MKQARLEKLQSTGVMQITGVEQGGTLQRIKIVDRQHSVAQNDQTIRSQFLERSVEMHDREPRRVRHVHRVTGNGQLLPLNSPIGRSRSTIWQSRCATRSRATRRPMLTAHSRWMEISESV